MDSRRVLLHFQRHSDRKFYTLRDIYRDMNMKAEDAEKAVITLAKRNYCRMGKNSRIEVNPEVFTLPD